MAFLVVPTTVAFPEYTQRTVLEGREYVLRFIYNEREGAWYLDISDSDENPLMLGMKLVADWNLLRRATDARLPTGELYAVDLAGSDQSEDVAGRRAILQIARDPGRNDLGDDGRVELVYVDAAEVADAEAA